MFEDKIPLEVIGLTTNPSSQNAYALILKERDGRRRLPIIIGIYEAQAIALEMENFVPPRPMTHDLLKSVIEAFNVTLTEVYINELKEGTFYAKLIFADYNLEIDARPSDAIALAMRCNCPIYVSSEVLDEAGMLPPDDEMFDNNPYETYKSKKTEKPTTSSSNKLQELQKKLDAAIAREDYETAAKIRDEIKKILESS